MAIYETEVSAKRPAKKNCAMALKMADVRKLCYLVILHTMIGSSFSTTISTNAASEVFELNLKIPILFKVTFSTS